MEMARIVDCKLYLQSAGAGSRVSNESTPTNSLLPYDLVLCQHPNFMSTYRGLMSV